jgi:hypothetical protein
MKFPAFADLEEMRTEGAQWRSYGDQINPNPRLFKYYWWIFCKYSDVEGPEFLSAKNRLCYAEAHKLTRRLEEEGEPFIVYSERLPRIGAPFDPNHKKWQGIKWAARFEDDRDAICKGHK